MPKRTIQKVSCVSTRTEQVDTFSTMQLDMHDTFIIEVPDMYHWRRYKRYQSTDFITKYMLATVRQSHCYCDCNL